jgi:hypothetical protein
LPQNHESVIATRAANLAPKPHSLNFEQAAAVPLVHGTAGGVGSGAVGERCYSGLTLFR